MPWAPAKHQTPAQQRRSDERAYDRDRNRNQAHRRLLWSTRYLRFRLALLAQRTLCQDCTRVVATEVHHVRKLATHPEDLCDPEQCLVLCQRCHTTRTNRGE